MSLVKEFISPLVPRGANEVLDALKNMSVKEKIKKISEMRTNWGGMYGDLLHSKAVLDNIREETRKEFAGLKIIEKIDYIENIEKMLPEIFSDFKDKDLLHELKEHIMKQDFQIKSKLVWRFFKSWPDLFKDVEDDPRIDPETNQLMLLFKIKGTINDGNVSKLQEFIRETGQKYGRENVLEKAADIRIPEDRFGSTTLFNRKDLEQLKLSLYKETRTDKERSRDELYDVYAFIGYTEFIEKAKNMHEKRLGIENLVKLDKYNSSSLSQVPLMKIRMMSQYGTDKDAGVFGVYIPKEMWTENYTHNSDIPDFLREFIDDNKFKF